MIEIIALAAACLLLGLASGWVLARRHDYRADVAPVPEFDRNNPINARARKEVINGVEWTVYGGYR